MPHQRRRRVPKHGNPAAPGGAALIEQHEEWEAGERHYFSEASMRELTTMDEPIVTIDEAVSLPELAAA